MALVGLLLYNAGFISLVLTERWVNISKTAVLVGFIALGFGIAGMGLIAIAKGALGRLSFAPLLLTVSYLGFAFIVGGSLAEFLVMLILVVYAIGWLLLGIGLWTTEERTAESGLAA